MTQIVLDVEIIIDEHGTTTKINKVKDGSGQEVTEDFNNFVSNEKLPTSTPKEVGEAAAKYVDRPCQPSNPATAP